MKSESKKKRPTVGDIIEVQTPKGLAYVQFSHQDSEYGYLIRVLPGLYKERPDSFSDIVRLKERYCVFYPLSLAVSRGLVRIVAREPLPEEARKFPLMRMAGARDRSGRVLNWWLRDGEKSWPVEQLTPEQEELSLAQIWNHEMLVQRILENWSP